jgi:kinetochore protein NDC80
MHYPFPISKASMQAVGTMHTWPTLLASITWMVELLTYDEEVQNDGEYLIVCVCVRVDFCDGK